MIVEIEFYHPASNFNFLKINKFLPEYSDFSYVFSNFISIITKYYIEKKINVKTVIFRQ